MSMEAISGCLCKLAVLFVGVLIMRALLFGIHTRLPVFGNSQVRLPRLVWFGLRFAGLPLGVPDSPGYLLRSLIQIITVRAIYAGYTGAIAVT